MMFVHVIEHRWTIRARAQRPAPCWYLVEWLRSPSATHGAYHMPLCLGLN
jgi:hypothetical protein